MQGAGGGRIREPAVSPEVLRHDRILQVLLHESDQRLALRGGQLAYQVRAVSEHGGSFPRRNRDTPAWLIGVTRSSRLRHASVTSARAQIAGSDAGVTEARHTHPTCVPARAREVAG